MSGKAEAGEVQAPELLRALSASAPGGPRWQLELRRLQTALPGGGADDASVLRTLLRLARAQGRAEYLALAELCLRGQAYEPAALDAIWHDLRTAYPFLRDCLWHAGPQERAAAARLLCSFAQESEANAQEVDWALRAERDPATAAAMMASLHSLRRGRAGWVATLAQFQTVLNEDGLRFQAACCRLDAERDAAPEVVAELAFQLYDPDGQALPSLRAIALYGAGLPPPAAVRLWSGLLKAAVEFDGAAEIAAQLLRAATGDRREGWNRVRLTARMHDGEPAPPPGVLAAVVRLACAGIAQRLTGRKLFLPLPSGQVPAREYPEVRAFPPAVDLDDPVVRQALRTMVASEPLWQGRTELWRLFGLPERRLELRLLLDEMG